MEVRLETRVPDYADEAVNVAPGEPIGTMSLVWTAGVKPAAALGPLQVEKVNGRVKVNEFLEVAGHEGVVWAVGDCAAVPDGNGGLHPPTAQHGMRAAVAAAGTSRRRSTGASRAVPVLNDRSVGVDRSPYRRRADPGGALLGIHRVVAVADRVPGQAAGDLQEAEGGDQVVVRPAVPTRDRATGDAPRCRARGEAGGDAAPMRGAAQPTDVDRVGVPVLAGASHEH